MLNSELTPIFFPQSIAVIGASSNPLNLGHHVLKILVSGGFKGRTYAINTRSAEVLGLRTSACINEVPDVAKALAMQPLPRGNRVAIVTLVGGPGVTAAEACSRSGVTLARLSDSTRDELKKVLPSEAITMNPVDLTWGGIPPQIFSRAIEIVLRDENVDGLIAIRKMTEGADIEEPPPEILKAMAGSDKPVVACWLGSEKPALQEVQACHKVGIPAYLTADRAAAAMAGLVRYAEIKNRME